MAQRMIPKTAGELEQYLKQLHDNQQHVLRVTVNPTNDRIEVDLDEIAHLGGYPDVYIPIKPAKIADAKTLVEKMLSESRMGTPPSAAEAQQLYDMINRQGA